MAILNDRTGETRVMNNGLSAKIIRYRNNTDIDIEFCNGQNVFNRPYGDFKRGQISCPLIIEYIENYAKIINPNLKTGISWIMDIEDLPLLGKTSWCIDSLGYICGTIKSGTVRLHTLIMNSSNEIRVDHKDGNKLDVRKSNLRLCSHAENNRNQAKRSNNLSGYKGVSHHKKSNKWRARIGINRRYIYLGSHDTPKKAAIAYNKAAIKYHGDFARLNIID